ncbi:MAG: hypothetical protein KatS3mg103_0188 [Phycisphaerales bacterium]|nr:MAG: hypothetical protein KatS3mg103_0188 [Phycisphaerales bacterium]
MSGRFRFSLQAVLEQRRQAERRAQVVLAGVLAEQLALDGELERLRRAVQAERRRAVEMMQGRVQPAVLRELVAGELGADCKARALAVALAGVRRRAEQARQALREAAVARQAIESLREKRLGEWRQAQVRAELAELDDLSVMRRGLDASEG